MLFEFAIVLALIFLNGLLAMSELAVVQSRTTRLKVMADGGSRGARIAMKLAEEPGRFLSAVQIGITLVGILAGAISGATLGERFGAALAGLGLSPNVAEAVGVGLVVVTITYLSLIIGELVPKQIALRAPERVAARVAPLMLWISRVTAPLVWVLDRSGKLVLRLLGQSGQPERRMSEEEVRLLIAEAQTAGIIELSERRMIAGVMRIADRTARGLMTPRIEVELIDINASPEGVTASVLKSDRSRFPAYEGEPDNIVGIVHARDLLARSRDEAAGSLRELVHEAPVVMEALSALDVIERLRGSSTHMVLVFDEYGSFEGLITPMDVLSAITGEFDSEDDPKFVRRADGSYLVAGWMPIDEFADLMGVPVQPGATYATVAGLVLELAGHIPSEGEVLEVSGLRIEVVDMDSQRIDKLLVSSAREGHARD